MVGSKNTSFRSQSQRMEAALVGSNKSSRTPPPIGMSPQPGLFPPGLPARPKSGSGKLNTPSKKPSSGSSAQGAAAGAGQRGGLFTAQGNGSAQAHGAAGQQHGRSEFDFPDDDEDEQLQAAFAASMVTVQATGYAANSSGGAAAAAAGPAKPKARLKPQADRQKQFQEEEQQRRQPDAQRASFPRSGAAGFHCGDENAGAAKQAGPGRTQADGAAAAAAGATKLAQAPGGKQLGIRQFARTMPPGRSNVSGPLPAGMLNHGNTCYLNAILQALLSLPSLAGDLSQFNSSSSSTGGSSSTAAADFGSSLVKSSDSSFSQLKLPPDGVTAAMVACLRQYQAACRAGDGGDSGAAISPRMVREAMKKRASHWGAARQEDAHEFFTALLNALADEVQQAQLEYIQHSSSSRRRKQTAAGAVCAIAEVTEGAANGGLELPPLADDAAAQACQARQQDAAAATAEAAVEPQPAGQGPDELGPDQPPQQQQQRESSPAVEELQPASRSTPACQLPSMSVSQALCPVTRNFLGCLQHTYTCSVCGKSTVQKEQFNHLILDLPQDDDSGSNGSSGAAAAGVSGLLGAFSNGNRAPVADLSSLLANHFNPETCEKACEGCGASAVQHRVEHAIRRLPRVLVVQLKRFKWVISPSGIPDCSKMPTPVQPDKQLFLGRLCVPNRPVPPLLASLMPQRLVRSAMEAVGDQQHKQQQKQMLGSSAAAGGSSNGSAAAVADGGLDGLLAPAGSNADAAAGQDQRQDQRQQKPVAKRLGNLRPQGDVQVLKKPKVVDGNHFGPTKRTDGSLASFWGNKDGLQVHGIHVRKTSPLARPQQRQRAASPDLHMGPWGDSDVAGDPGTLRRNNSSSAVPHVDLTGLADAADAAADSEFDRDLQLALALSVQEQQQPQQLQLGSGPAEDAEVPQVDSDWQAWSDDQLPDWIKTGHVPAAAAAAPPPSPVKSRSDRENSVDDSDQGVAVFGSYAGQDRPSARTGKQQQGPGGISGAAAAVAEASPAAAAIPDAELLALTPVDASAAEPTAVADGSFALTPPLDQQQQQQAEPMDIDHGTGVDAGQLFEGLAPPSPLLQAARPDRSGRVSSSTAPGGSQQRLVGQKLGGAAPGQLVAATAAAAAAARRLEKQSLWSKPKPDVSQELEVAALSEEEQIKRAIEESMREQQQGASLRLEPLMQDAATDTAAPMEVDKDVIVLDDEEATLQRVLAESAAVYEQQQQERLKQLQQQDKDASGLLAATAAAATSGEGQQDGRTGVGQGAAAGQQAKKERPPALLLRLLEDSDYEAEQDELDSSSRGKSSTGEGPSRSSSPDSADAADGGGTTAAAAAGGQQPGQQKRRKGRARKQQQLQGPGGDSSAAAAAAAGGGFKRQGAAKLPSQSTAAAAAAAADGCDAGDAAGGHGSKSQPLEFSDGLEEDKENLAAAATAAAGEVADIDTVPDRGTSKPAAAAGKGGKQQKQKVRRALGEILGNADSSARNAAAGAAAAAAAAAADPPQKPPAVAAAVAAAQAAAAGSNAAAAGGNPADGVQELQDGVAAGAVGSWPQEAAASYSLSAVVRHMGELVSVGHFTSDVLNHKINRWFHYDDSRVHALSSIETVARLCQRDGYLFFYVNDAIGDQ